MELAELLRLGRRTEHFFFVNKVISYVRFKTSQFSTRTKSCIDVLLYETGWSVDVKIAVQCFLIITTRGLKKNALLKCLSIFSVETMHIICS